MEGLDDFSIEMTDYEVSKRKKFDRVWNVGEGGSICGVPLLHDGLLYFGACNRNVYALDAESGRQVWKFRTQGRIVHSSPVHWNGTIFIGSFDRHLYALDARTGKLQWKFETQEEVASTPCTEDGRVFFGSRDQFVYCLEAGTGSLVWKFKTNEEVVAVLTASDGRLFVGSFDRNFYCIDTKTGGLIWKFETQGEIHNLDKILVREGIVYIASFDNNLYAIDVKTGRQLWKFPTGTYGNNASPTFYKGRLYMTSRDGILYALTLEGKLVWKYAKNEMLSIVEISDDRIYVGSEDQNLYCLDMQGKELWKFRTQGAIWLKPVVRDGRVFFPSWDCHMYSVDISSRSLAWKFRTEGSPSHLPPPYEVFEVEMKLPASEMDVERKKTYDFGLGLEDEENTSEYQSRITYQISTQYSSKGKYQIDTRTEEF